MTAESFKNRVAAVRMKRWQIRQDLICAAIEWDKCQPSAPPALRRRDAFLHQAVADYYAASKEFIGKSSEDIAREQEAEAEGK